jgi:hypothetical protein
MIQTALAETDAQLPTETTIATNTTNPTNTTFPTNTPDPTSTDTPTHTPSDTPSPTYTSSPTETLTPSATRTKKPTPTGPAEVTASIPSSVPYERSSGGQCVWKISITFQEENGVDATIDEIGNIFVSGRYKYYLGGEHKRDVDLFIPGHDSYIYEYTIRDNICDSHVGGVLTFTYYGYDANGYQIYGNIFTRFTKP